MMGTFSSSGFQWARHSNNGITEGPDKICDFWEKKENGDGGGGDGGLTQELD
jgi:hypothetical protein